MATKVVRNAAKKLFAACGWKRTQCWDDDSLLQRLKIIHNKIAPNKDTGDEELNKLLAELQAESADGCVFELVDEMPETVETEADGELVITEEFVDEPLVDNEIEDEEEIEPPVAEKPQPKAKRRQKATPKDSSKWSPEMIAGLRMAADYLLGIVKEFESADGETVAEKPKPSKPKPKGGATRLEQLKKWLSENGPALRKDIVAGSGIPTGTVSVYLVEKNGFVKDDQNLWTVKE